MRAQFFVAAIIIFLSVSGLFAEEARPAETSEQSAQSAKPERSGLATGLIAFGAALAIGATAIATGIAQSRIGAAGAGAIAERPETSGTIIVLLAIPETMVILGFIVSVIILLTL